MHMLKNKDKFDPNVFKHKLRPLPPELVDQIKFVEEKWLEKLFQENQHKVRSLSSQVIDYIKKHI